jgi:hypothetical protein
LPLAGPRERRPLADNRAQREGGTTMATEDRSEAAARTSEELVEEHRHLGDLIVRLEATRNPQELAGMLDEMHGVLLRHFAHEQYPGGFYETLGACKPAFRDDLRVLVDQHFRIISGVEGLRQRTRRADAAEWTELKREASAIVAELGQHERRESDLVSRLLQK